MTVVEVNFDGIVGLTHHYGGLSPGNVASQLHRHQVSCPRQAALEGLSKMKLLADMGIAQAVLPPPLRPDTDFLRQHGFSGSDAETIESAARTAPAMLSLAASASSMWAANAATVSPSSDTADQRVHVTPANLVSTEHRRLESHFTTRLLRFIFSCRDRFEIHDPLPNDSSVADEGAANHMRLCSKHGSRGIEVFVYGRDGQPATRSARNYPSRQTRAACQAIVDRHELNSESVVLVQQSPAAIDAGVFHNDVIAVANQHVLLCHEAAYVNQPGTLEDLTKKLPQLRIVEITSDQLPLADAVETYLFNSQLMTLPNGNMLFFCPADCADHPKSRSAIERIVAEVSEITEVKFVDVRQSMQNGGGPACLRLRVVLTEPELDTVHQPLFLTSALYSRLTDWVGRHYRTELTLTALGDPHLLTEVRTALDELTSILALGSIYPFQ
jgi:succinylarginine dihydrolase